MTGPVEENPYSCALTNAINRQYIRIHFSKKNCFKE